MCKGKTNLLLPSEKNSILNLVLTTGLVLGFQLGDNNINAWSHGLHTYVVITVQHQ
jgi:hypothetical protein